MDPSQFNYCKDIVIKISDYETTNNTFIRYCINIYIKSELHFWFEKIGKKNWSIRRRYSDFVLLKESLTKRYPACLIPPLPSKLNSGIPWRASNQINDTEFIESRRQRLEWFLNRLIAHPKLCQELKLLEFLNNEDSWNDNQLTIDETFSDPVNWRWINAQSRLIQLFESKTQTSSLNDLIKSKSLSNESLQMIDRGQHLQENIQNIIDCLTKFEDQSVTMHNLYKNYSEAFHDWCRYDNAVGDSLQTFGQLCESFSEVIECPVMNSNKMIVLSESVAGQDSVHSALTWPEIVLLLHELYDFGESWIELGGRMAMLQRQVQKYLDSIDDSNNQLERLRKGQSPKSGPLAQLKTKFSKSPTPSDISQLISSLESNLLEYNKTLISLKADKELFEKCVEEEIVHFEQTRARDLDLVMLSYASNQLTYNQQCLRIWQRARQSVE